VNISKSSTDPLPVSKKSTPKLGKNPPSIPSQSPKGITDRSHRAVKKRKIDSDNIIVGDIKDSDEELQLPIELYNHCHSILEDLMNHKYSHPFNQPVDPVALKIPDYFDVIKHPMDFGTISKQFKKNLYNSEEDFEKDILLVFDNAMIYNASGSDVYVMAQTLKKVFKNHWKNWNPKKKGNQPPLRIHIKPPTLPPQNSDHQQLNQISTHLDKE